MTSHCETAGSGPAAPTFTLNETSFGWTVDIRWADGGSAPPIAFASRREAELWVRRDAQPWLVRLAASTPHNR